MKLIALHHKGRTSHYLEGFNEQYKCIVYWEPPGEFIDIMDTSYFSYTKDNRVSKFTDPFRRQ